MRTPAALDMGAAAPPLLAAPQPPPAAPAGRVESPAPVETAVRVGSWERAARQIQAVRSAQ
ncbi:MAG: hypothetical protein ABI560_14460, partial [Myxococcales bacterium]